MTDLTDEHAAALAAATQRAEKAERDRATWTGNYIAAAARADRAEAALREAMGVFVLSIAGIGRDADTERFGKTICSLCEMWIAQDKAIRALLADDAREEEGT